MTNKENKSMVRRTVNLAGKGLEGFLNFPEENLAYMGGLMAGILITDGILEYLGFGPVTTFYGGIAGGFASGQAAQYVSRKYLAPRFKNYLEKRRRK